MTIVWGHNHFRIKRVQPHEIGLFDRAYDGVSFDLHQKYGHLFWIPFIPLGKVWTVNKGDGKKYVCHSDIEQMLDQNPGRSSKLSVFAWSGLLIIALVMMGISVSENMAKGRREKAIALQYKTAAAELAGRVDNAGADDYFLFNARKAGEASFGYKRIPFKILGVKDDELLLGSYHFPEDDRTAYSTKEELMSLILGSQVRDSFRVKKAVLKQAILAEGAAEKDFKGMGLQDYLPGQPMQLRLISIEHLAGPDPVAYKTVDPGKNYFELVNEGFDAHADSIVSTEEGQTGKLLKKDFKNGDIIAVQLSGDGFYTLYCSDKAKHVYEFQLYNSAGYLEVVEIED